MPNFTLRYIVALIIIIPFVSISYFLLHSGLEKQLSDSRVVNIAGRQRMLSQRISKVSLKISNGKDKSEIIANKKELEDSLTLWKKSHSGLQEGSAELGLPVGNSETVKNLFAAIKPFYQIIVKEAENIIREIEVIEVNGGSANVSGFTSMMLSSEASFLSGMDKIVFQYDKEAKERVENLRRMELVLLWTIFAVLAINGLFILRPAVKRLQSADKLKNEFISIASHQLRTPLTGIKWAAEQIIKKESLSGNGREYMNHVIMSAKNLSSLVDVLLNVSRLDAGKISAHAESVELIDFIQNLINEHKPMCDKKNLKVSFAHSMRTVAVKTDKSMFRDIAQALFSNAIEYTSDGGEIEITIEENRPKFIFIVKDNGIGIPKKEQNMFLFQKFHRSSNAKKIKPEGFGLGLYIAKQAADLLGGKIWFESEENKGSAFYAELPLEYKQ